ncbi:hypothetical protein VKT23_013925 [Stygiomarasmius scandens]|uniref:Uncharacterized protein n=1 Tax=Marasmiellus scandens TaxID=2682957 RepID=A0ABR1J676_9AGAR
MSSSNSRSSRSHHSSSSQSSAPSLSATASTAPSSSVVSTPRTGTHLPLDTPQAPADERGRYLFEERGRYPFLFAMSFVLNIFFHARESDAAFAVRNSRRDH